MTANSEFLCGPSIRHPAEIGRLCLEFATSQKPTSGAALEDCTFPSGVDSAVLLRVIKSSCSPAPRATAWSENAPLRAGTVHTRFLKRSSLPRHYPNRIRENEWWRVIFEAYAPQSSCYRVQLGIMQSVGKVGCVCLRYCNCLLARFLDTCASPPDSSSSSPRSCSSSKGKQSSANPALRTHWNGGK